MHTNKRYLPLLAVPLLTLPLALAQNKVTLTVDAAEGNHYIDPNIYGMANYGVDPAFAKEIRLPNARWGGDGATRYNWQVDSSNSGGDFYFLGGNGTSTFTPGAQVDAMIKTYKPAGTNPLITIPIIPYINSTSNFTCSYRKSVYGDQQAYNPYITINGDQCGNGVTLNGDQLLDTDIYYNHVDNTPAIQQAWISHLVQTFGKSYNGGIHYFQLDNEPLGWGNTHRDVQPNGALYSTIVDLGKQYASAIKQADPDAKVLGPSDFTLGGWVGDTSQQDGLLAGQYYLSQFAKYDKQNHKRTLDYFDEHFYGPGGSNAAELESTRALWDPTYNSGTWVEQYVFNGPMQLIRRFKSWTHQYYQYTPVSLSEYSMTNGGTTIYDALTQADTLGIFGREELAFADLWTIPAPQDPVAFSFRLFRNFDGKGSQYGDIWTRSISSNQSKLAIYGAKRCWDNSLTIIVINKTSQPITSPVGISHFKTAAGSAQLFQYASSDLTRIVHQPNLPLTKTGNTVIAVNPTFPALSASVIVIPYTK